MRLAFLSAAAFGLLTAPAMASSTSKFPTKEEIHAAIDTMPDFNALFDDLIKLTEDSDLPERMEKSAEKLKADLETSSALEPDRNGLPDIKLTLKILSTALADEEITNGLQKTLTDLEKIMEKHLDDEK